MATRQQKKQMLGFWGERFPGYAPFDAQFLLIRNGPLVSGVCLNSLREPQKYRPIYFVANMLELPDCIPLMYGYEPVTRFTPLELKYLDSDISVAAELMFSNAPFLRMPGSHGGYLQQMESCLLQETKGFRKDFEAPSVLTDLIGVAAYCGDTEFAQELLVEATSVLTQLLDNGTLEMPLDAWVARTRTAMERSEKAVQTHCAAIGLPPLPNQGLSYSRDAARTWRILALLRP